MSSRSGHRRRRSRVGLQVLGVAVLVAGAFALQSSTSQAPPVLPAPTASEPARPPSPAQVPDPPSDPSFDKTAYSLTDPASTWVIVNKTHPIAPSGYRPETSIVRGYQVATAAAGPLANLLDAGDADQLGFKIASAFRSYAYQQNVHDSLVAANGETAADRVSARPGYSEHQTGLAVDLITPADPGCDFDQCFAGTPGGRWLAANAWRYGFIVRYSAASTAVTGYSPEPWHLRFVGRALAAELHRSGVATLEEFFGVRGGQYRRG